MFEYGDDAGYSTIVGGQFNTVKGNYAMAIGGRDSFVMGELNTPTVLAAEELTKMLPTQWLSAPVPMQPLKKG